MQLSFRKILAWFNICTVLAILKLTLTNNFLNDTRVAGFPSKMRWISYPTHLLVLWTVEIILFGPACGSGVKARWMRARSFMVMVMFIFRFSLIYFLRLWRILQPKQTSLVNIWVFQEFPQCFSFVGLIFPKLHFIADLVLQILLRTK